VSLNLHYSIREGLKGLRRAKIASTVTITTVAFTLTLLDLFLILTVNVQHIINTLKSQISLEVFLESIPQPEEIERWKMEFSGLEGVARVEYVSPEQALDGFRKEFQEDPQALLGENPLPASFRVLLKSGYQNPTFAEAVVRRIESLPGVDEVVYHGKLIRAVHRYSRTVLWIDLGLLLVSFLSTVFLVSNTLRLTIFSQGRLIQAMKLIGATQGFIRRPYLVLGLVEGGLGGLIGSAVVWAVLQLVTLRFPLLLSHVEIFIWGPLVVGLLLGFLGSLIGLRRFLT
jgi:cell division transport system permease protein